MKLLTKLFTTNKPLLLSLLIAFVISLVSGIYYIFIEHINFVFYDASARLNIARRITDSLTPGLGQIGSIWPPFPQVFMMPFVMSDYLWQSGVAGWIVSGISYILTSFFIFKSVFVLTKNKWASFIASLAFLVNINAVYLQATAMSETFFWLTITANFYFLASYIKTRSYRFLVPASIAMFLCVLTRYESYALLAGSGLVILLVNLIWKNKWKNIQGALLLYLVPATFGVILWSTYLWLIFGDPLYWLHFYAGFAAAEPGSTVEKVRPSIPEAFTIYSTAVANMNGLFTTAFGVLSLLYVALSIRLKKEVKTTLILPLFLLFFMLLTLSRNTPIIQPPITLEGIVDKSINDMHEFNSRYGLNFLPYFAIFIGIFIARIKFMVLPFIWFTAVQTFAYFWTPYYLTYQLPRGVNDVQAPGIPWLKENYDGGLILISALKHDPDILALGLPYKSYIYEGSHGYWEESLVEPQKHASWVVFNRYDTNDLLTKQFKDKNLQEYGFELVHTHKGIEVYKRM